MSHQKLVYFKLVWVLSTMLSLLAGSSLLNQWVQYRLCFLLVLYIWLSQFSTKYTLPHRFLPNLWCIIISECFYKYESNLFSLSFPLPVSGFHQHSQGDLWEDPGRGVWYQQWGETLFPPLFSSSLNLAILTLLFYFLPFFPSSSLCSPRCCFSSSVCGLQRSPSPQKEGGNLPLLLLTPAKQNSLLSPALFSTRHAISLSLFLSLFLFLSPSLSLCICQLINSAHPSRSQSFGKNTNKSASLCKLHSKLTELLDMQSGRWLSS